METKEKHQNSLTISISHVHVMQWHRVRATQRRLHLMGQSYSSLAASQPRKRPLLKSLLAGIGFRPTNFPSSNVLSPCTTNNCVHEAPKRWLRILPICMSGGVLCSRLTVLLALLPCQSSFLSLYNICTQHTSL